jgi:hypothetical protein
MHVLQNTLNAKPTIIVPKRVNTVWQNSVKSVAVMIIARCPVKYVALRIPVSIKLDTVMTNKPVQEIKNVATTSVVLNVLQEKANAVLHNIVMKTPEHVLPSLSVGLEQIKKNVKMALTVSLVHVVKK